MHSDSIYKSAIRNFINMFFKIMGGFFAIVILLIGFSSVASTSAERKTVTAVLPNHEWKAGPFSPTKPTLLQIPIVGPIGFTKHLVKENMFSIFQDLHSLQMPPETLKGLLLYINSPGGTSDDSDTIFRMILEFKKQTKLPVYAYIDGMCASGGLMISLAADTIIASTPSRIGSVGVIMPTAFNFSKAMQQFGIESKTLYAGKSKDELNPFRPWAANEAQNIQDHINAYYDRFVHLVATHRPMLTEKAIRQEGANIFSAEKALEFGFIDEIDDSYMHALEKISSSLDLTDYQVIELRPEMSFNDLLGARVNSMFQTTFNQLFGGTTSLADPNKPLYLHSPCP